MEELKKKLEQMKEEAEKLIKDTRMMKGNKEKSREGLTQWFKNDLILQEEIQEVKRDILEQMLAVVEELSVDKGGIKQIDRDSSTLVEETEDEDEIFNRFRSR